MKILYSDQKLFDGKGSSIFIAGPTPRSKDVVSWRPKALNILKDCDFDGTVLVPERQDWSVKFDYTDQVEWELTGLSLATKIVFWVPREMQTMPALVTNVEFGYWLAKSPERVIYGRPDDSQKNKYLDYLYVKETKREPIVELAKLLEEAVMHIVFP